MVADARSLNPTEKVDLVVAGWLLNYAQNQSELQAMCDGISRCLRPGGRFVTVNCNPQLHFPTAPSYRKYGFETLVSSPWEEGSPIQWIFHLSGEGGGMVEVENYHLNVGSHETALRQAGFQAIRWVSPRLSAEGLALYGEPYWRKMLEYPPMVFMECIKTERNGLSKEERKEAEQEKFDKIPKKALQNGMVQRMVERVHEIQDVEQDL
jgi:hypothetical protein